jgi:hypothetical protein
MSTRRLATLLVAPLLTCPFSVQARAQNIMTVANADTIDVALVRDIDDARRRGLPAEPLLAKVREGRLKRAPVPRIRSAVAALATRLDSARAALGAGATMPEIGAGADALAAGAGPAALRTVRDAAAGRPLAAPLGALAQLVASGVPASRATAMVVELLRRNATPAQLLAFGNAVETDAMSGMPAEESAQYRLHSFGTAAGSRGSADLTQPAASAPGSMSNQGRPPTPATSTPKRRP